MVKKNAEKSVEELSADLAASFNTSKVAAVETPSKKVASKGTNNLMLSMGLLAFPIKIYKATDEDTVSFNQLHDACNSKLKQQDMFCPTCDVAVAKENIVKGYEYEKGQFITVTKDELAACKAAADDQLTIQHFVEFGSVDPIYFQSTYYMAPEKGGEMQFDLLRATMRSENKAAIATYAASGREQTVLIRPFGRGIALHYLFFEYEIRSFAGWDKMKNDDAIDPKFMAAAKQLVNSMTETFAPETMGDSYLVNTRAMLASKVAGNPVPVVAKAAKMDPSTDLFAAITASLDVAKAKKAKKVA